MEGSALSPRPRGRPKFNGKQLIARARRAQVERKTTYQALVADIKKDAVRAVAAATSKSARKTLISSAEMRVRGEEMLYALEKRNAGKALEAALELCPHSNAAGSADATQTQTNGTLEYDDPFQSQPAMPSGDGCVTYAGGHYGDLEKACILADMHEFQVQLPKNRVAMLRGSGSTQMSLTQTRKYLPTFRIKKKIVPMNLEELVRCLHTLPPYKRAPTCRGTHRAHAGRVLYLTSFITWLHALLWRTKKSDAPRALKDLLPDTSQEDVDLLLLSLDIFKIGIGLGDRGIAEYAAPHGSYANTPGVARTSSLNDKIHGFAKKSSVFPPSDAWRRTYGRLFAPALLKTTPLPSGSEFEVYLMQPQVVMVGQMLLKHDSKTMVGGTLQATNHPDCETKLRSNFKAEFCGQFEGLKMQALPFLGQDARGVTAAPHSPAMPEKFSTGREYFKVEWQDHETLAQLYSRMALGFAGQCTSESLKDGFTGKCVVWYDDPDKDDSFPWAAAQEGAAWYGNLERVETHPDARSSSHLPSSFPSASDDDDSSQLPHGSAAPKGIPQDGADIDSDEEDIDSDEADIGSDDEDARGLEFQIRALGIHQSALERSIGKMQTKHKDMRTATLSIFRKVHHESSTPTGLWTWTPNLASSGENLLENTTFAEILDKKHGARECHINVAACMTAKLHSIRRNSCVVQSLHSGAWRPAKSPLMQGIARFISCYGPAADVADSDAQENETAAQDDEYEQQRATDRSELTGPLLHGEVYQYFPAYSDCPNVKPGRNVLYYFDELFDGTDTARGWVVMTTTTKTISNKERIHHPKCNKVLAYNMERGESLKSICVELNESNYGVGEDKVWVMLRNARTRPQTNSLCYKWLAD